MSFKQISTYMNRIPLDDPKRYEFVRVVVPALQGNSSLDEKSLIWICPYCKATNASNNCSFTSYYSFTRHLSNSHRYRLPLNGNIFSSTSTSTIHRCDICDRNFSRREHLLAHLKSQLHLSKESLNESTLVFNTSTQQQQAFNSSSNALYEADKEDSNDNNNNAKLDLSLSNDSSSYKDAVMTARPSDMSRPMQDRACSPSSSQNKVVKPNRNLEDDNDDEVRLFNRWISQTIPSTTGTSITTTTTSTRTAMANAFDSSNNNELDKQLDDGASKDSNIDTSKSVDTDENENELLFKLWLQTQRKTGTSSILVSSDQNRPKLDPARTDSNKNESIRLTNENDEKEEKLADEALFNAWLINSITTGSNSFLSSSFSASLSSSNNSPKTQDRSCVVNSIDTTNDDDDNDSLLLSWISNNMSSFESLQPSTTSKRSHMQAFRPGKSSLKKTKNSNKKRVRFSK